MSENAPWTTTKVADLGRRDDVVQTGPFGAQLHAKDYTKEGIPLILIRNIKESGLDESNIPKISNEDAERLSRYSLIPGDIVFSRVGRVGSCFLAEDKHKGWIISGQTLRTRTDPRKVYPGFLFYALQQESVREYISGASVGTTRTSINTSILEDIEIPLPPLPEQKKIAEILSGIDHVIASNQNRIRSSQLLKKALISRHIESIEHEVDEAKLGDLVNSVDSGWSPDCLKRPPLSDSEWSVLKTTSVTWTGFDQQERKALPINLSPKEELVVEAGDILITRAGPADRTGVVAYADKKAVNTMISDKIIRLRCDTSTIEPRFLSIFLGTDYAQRQMLKGKVGMASSQTNISQQLLREMEIRFPPLPEQRRISEIIAELQKTINQFQKYIDHTEKLKVSLSSDLLSGRKRVSI